MSIFYDCSVCTVFSVPAALNNYDDDNNDDDDDNYDDKDNNNNNLPFLFRKCVTLSVKVYIYIYICGPGSD